MLHDPDEYHQPEAFNPDRFLKDGAINPQVRNSMIAFGFGRRYVVMETDKRHAVLTFVV